MKTYLCWVHPIYLIEPPKLAPCWVPLTNLGPTPFERIPNPASSLKTTVLEPFTNHCPPRSTRILARSSLAAYPLRQQWVPPPLFPTNGCSITPFIPTISPPPIRGRPTEHFSKEVAPPTFASIPRGHPSSTNLWGTFKRLFLRIRYTL